MVIGQEDGFISLRKRIQEEGKMAQPIKPAFSNFRCKGISPGQEEEMR